MPEGFHRWTGGAGAFLLSLAKLALQILHLPPQLLLGSSRSWLFRDRSF